MNDLTKAERIAAMAKIGTRAHTSPRWAMGLIMSEESPIHVTPHEWALMPVRVKTYGGRWTEGKGLTADGSQYATIRAEDGTGCIVIRTEEDDV